MMLTPALIKLLVDQDVSVHAAACQSGAQSLVSDCSSVIQLATNNPTLRAQAMGLNGATDAQIEAAIAATPAAKPTPA